MEKHEIHIHVGNKSSRKALKLVVNVSVSHLRPLEIQSKL